MVSLLGWKDVLRPIRDGYRHLFPSPDTGPTPEERDRQRKLDRLKGFTYFDTIDQLKVWTEADSDPLQRANTPLLLRSKCSDMEKGSQADVLLCHDYSGNYHGYEAMQATGVDEESYTCEYLQFIDTFIYFSHKLVCVPPPSWTNLLHRNGVSVLGTLLVEPQSQGAEELLRSVDNSVDSSPTYPMAEKLANIARHYGFDGWLINIEKPFPKDHWNCSVVEDFLRQLGHALGPDRRLIWYDAITTDNKVSYQNALNVKNLPFAKACGGILVNYCWNEKEARHSYQLANKHGLSPDQVFFGVDVWAQNKSSFTQPRVTYPEFGGGGTHTGIAVNKLAEIGLSAGIFAPAWSFEHFPTRGHGIECAMWDGHSLPEDLTCSCGDPRSYHPANRMSCITLSARQYPAGSDSFFHSDFNRGFGRHNELAAKRIYGSKTIHAQLSSQSVLPHMATTSVRDGDVDNGVNILSQRLEDTMGNTHLEIEAHSTSPLEDKTTQIYERWLPLFKLAMPADGALELTIAYKGLVGLPMASVSFYLRFSNRTRFLTAKKTGEMQFHRTSVCLDDEVAYHAQLEELGLHVRAPHLGERTMRILEVHKISIVPRITELMSRHASLDNVRLERGGEGETEHHRLCWTYYDRSEEGTQVPGMPYSKVTGPFSYFVINIDGIDMDRVYALECIVPESIVKELKGTYCETGVTGFGFDGKKLAQSSVRVHID